MQEEGDTLTDCFTVAKNDIMDKIVKASASRAPASAW